MSRTGFHGPIAVVDVETTGLFPFRHDRVVEIAAVVLDETGAIEKEFVSLVNPARDIGPSSIHGLSSSDVIHAPLFGEIADELANMLGGTIAIAAHNVRFDRQFIKKEFERIDAEVPDVFWICTMELAGGGSLTDCCDCYSVARDGNAHHALGDARAAAKLLATLLSDASELKSRFAQRQSIAWPSVGGQKKPAVTREDSRRRQEQPPSYLQSLLRRSRTASEPIATEGSMMAYTAILDRVLEDRHISDAEGTALIEMATHWGMSGDQIGICHHDYLGQLVVAALADGVVTDTEKHDLHVVAKLLGQDALSLDAILCDAQSKLARTSVRPVAPQPTSSSLAGKRVCFTGELQCSLKGEPISRALASNLATSSGLEVVDNVSKKLELLVLADPESQSGKAKKARSYGVRIMHEAVFWKAIGIEVD